MSLLDAVIAAKLAGSGGGGSVTAEAVASAIGDMSSAQAAQALKDLGGLGNPKPVLVEPVVKMTAAGEGVNMSGSYAPDDIPELSLWGTVDGENVRIVGINDPNSPYDAVNKQWCDGIYVNVSGATPTIEPDDHHVYRCGTLTSLTISTPPSTGSYSIVFTSGSTSTSTTIPSTILGLENFAAEANTMYEINVLDNRAVVGSWGVSA